MGSENTTKSRKLDLKLCLCLWQRNYSQHTRFVGGQTVNRQSHLFLCSHLASLTSPVRTTDTDTPVACVLAIEPLTEQQGSFADLLTQTPTLYSHMVHRCRLHCSSALTLSIFESYGRYDRCSRCRRSRSTTPRWSCLTGATGERIPTPRADGMAGRITRRAMIATTSPSRSKGPVSRSMEQSVRRVSQSYYACHQC